MPERWKILMAALLAALIAVPAGAAVLTGEVRSLGAQPLYVPPLVGPSVVMLQMFVPDGAHVKKGDAVLRVDASRAAAQLQSLRDQIQKTRYENAKELADLELKAVDAEIALIDAKAAQASAAVDAAIPAKLVPAIDYDRYQGTFTSSQHEVDLAERNLAAARAAVVRSRNDGAIQLEKLEMQLAFNQDQVDIATLYATHDGTVVHDFITVSFNGQQAKGRFEQGSNAFAGARVGQVVAADSGYAVHAWVLESDRNAVRVGQNVRLGFDALPEVQVAGAITAITGSATPKPEWGSGRYYGIDIEADGGLEGLKLLPGMSVRVDTEPAEHAATVAHASPVAAAEPLQASGEIYARDTLPVVPPQIPGVWQLNITRMAGDGARIDKGETIVVFAAGDIAQELPASQSKLAETNRALDKLKLDLANQMRDVELAVAKARADADKAARKAEQPEAYVPGVEYKKLVIDRDRAEKVLKLTEHRAAVAADYRQAQLQQAEAEVDIAQHEVNRLMQSLAKLTLKAPRPGILLHRSEWNGEKYDVGSQVFRGTTVADIPDLDTLAVHASLPEHDFARVAVGQHVVVTLSGGIGRQLRGHIRSIGRSVHSKSRAEPEPVIDLDIVLDEDSLEGLKPGQPVQVRIQPGAPAAEHEA